MAGRGRGRGRGILAEAKPPVPGGGDRSEEKVQTTNDAPRRMTVQLKELENSLNSLSYEPTEDDLHSLEQIASDALANPDDIRKIAHLIYNRVAEDREFAKAAAMVCDKFCNLPNEGTVFRSSILSLVQGDYKNRETLIDTEPFRFLSCFCMLVHLFGTMRLATGEVMQPLVGPIYDCCELMIEKNTNSDDLCECLCGQLPAVGRDLQDNGDERMQTLMEMCRKTIISQETTPQTRCYLLEMVEQYLRRWQQNPNEVTRFYCDTISEIFAEDVLREIK